MKKTMRIATIILALVLATSCFVGGTFAKYVASNNGNDSARVAYWGWTPGALTIDMFDGEYDAVNNENDDNLVAPGTTKTTTFAFAYTPKSDTVNALTAGAIAAPEVAYQFTITPTITGDYDALDANTNFYWTLKTPGAADATKYQTVAEFLAAIKALSGDASGSKRYEANTLPTNFTDTDEVYTIGWAWDFYTTDDHDLNVDTVMGNAQDLDDVTFNIEISAVQLDA